MTTSFWAATLVQVGARAATTTARLRWRGCSTQIDSALTLARLPQAQAAHVDPAKRCQSVALLRGACPAHGEGQVRRAGVDLSRGPPPAARSGDRGPAWCSDRAWLCQPLRCAGGNQRCGEVVRCRPEVRAGCILSGHGRGSHRLGAMAASSKRLSRAGPRLRRRRAGAADRACDTALTTGAAPADGGAGRAGTNGGGTNEHPHQNHSALDGPGSRVAAAALLAACGSRNLPTSAAPPVTRLAATVAANEEMARTCSKARRPAGLRGSPSAACRAPGGDHVSDGSTVPIDFDVSYLRRRQGPADGQSEPVAVRPAQRAQIGLFRSPTVLWQLRGFDIGNMIVERPASSSSTR